MKIRTASKIPSVTKTLASIIRGEFSDRKARFMGVCVCSKAGGERNGQSVKDINIRRARRNYNREIYWKPGRNETERGRRERNATSNFRIFSRRAVARQLVAPSPISRRWRAAHRGRDYCRNNTPNARDRSHDPLRHEPYSIFFLNLVFLLVLRRSSI